MLITARNFTTTHSYKFTFVDKNVLSSDALGDCSCSFASKKAVLTASTLQISELFSHLQCALQRVILQVKLRYTNYCSHLKHTLNYILLTVVQFIHCGLTRVL